MATQYTPEGSAGYRVWQLAKLLNIRSIELLQFARMFGVEVKSASSKIEPICAQTLLSVYSKALP